MKFNELPLKNAYCIEPETFHDNRGFFERLFCKKELEQIACNKEIVQINHSLTKRRGAVRGMHFQYPPYAEIKMVKCITGKVFDVIIDIRKKSPDFLQWHGEIISAENMKIVYIPEGFAHGFQTLEENCELLYFHTGFYNKDYEGAIRYNDPLVGINWKLEITEMSERDRNHPLLDNNFRGIEL